MKENPQKGYSASLPSPPEWDSVKRLDHGKRRGNDYFDEGSMPFKEDQARLERLADWVEFSLHSTVSLSAEEWKSEADLSEFLNSRLTPTEHALLLREFDRRRRAKGQRRKRGMTHFPDIAQALRSSPSPRFLCIVADMMELGFFTGHVTLEDDFDLLEVSKTRETILDILINAYPTVARNLLAERATDLTPFFRVDNQHRERSWADRHREVQDYKRSANDDGRVRVTRLLQSIYHNS